MVKARIYRDSAGVHRVFCQRNKFKHWHELGKYHETDVEFQKALRDGKIVWNEGILEKLTLF